MEDLLIITYCLLAPCFVKLPRNRIGHLSYRHQQHWFLLMLHLLTTVGTWKIVQTWAHKWLPFSQFSNSPCTAVLCEYDNDHFHNLVRWCNFSIGSFSSTHQYLKPIINSQVTKLKLQYIRQNTYTNLLPYWYVEETDRSLTIHTS